MIILKSWKRKHGYKQPIVCKHKANNSTSFYVHIVPVYNLSDKEVDKEHSMVVKQLKIMIYTANSFTASSALMTYILDAFL